MEQHKASHGNTKKASDINQRKNKRKTNNNNMAAERNIDLSVADEKTPHLRVLSDYSTGGVNEPLPPFPPIETEELKVAKTILKFKTCAEWAEYVENNPSYYMDDKIVASTKYPPTDGMTAEDFANLSDDEFCALANEISLLPHKSNPGTMYAHGYAVTWDFVKKGALMRGLIIKDERTKTPTFLMPNKCKGENKTNEDAGNKKICSKRIWYIDHGKRANTKEVKLSFSEKAYKKINSLFVNVSRLDRAKIIEMFLDEKLDEFINLKKMNLAEIRYRPIAEEPLDIGDIDDLDISDSTDAND